MIESGDIDRDWIGRLVRVLIVFRCFVLLVTITTLPKHDHTTLVGVVAIIALLISLVPLRAWGRIAPTVSRHPLYLTVELLLTTLILGAAGARSPFFYFTLGTAILAGVIYGRQGALPFSVVLIALYELIALEGFPSMHPLDTAHSIVFLPMLYPAAVGAGVVARELIERGAQTEELLRQRTGALEAERQRLDIARELHDSLAKTIEGLAMTASVLPRRCERDPTGASALARTLVTDARQAALEARTLMSGLREEVTGSFAEAVRQRAAMLGERSEIVVRVECSDPGAGDSLSLRSRHELLRILGEAVINAVRHGNAELVVVTLAQSPEDLTVEILDDGRGLPGPVAFEALKAEGHFGLAGMRERSEVIGGELAVENREHGGTRVTIRVPLGATVPAGEEPSADQVIELRAAAPDPPAAAATSPGLRQ